MVLYLKILQIYLLSHKHGSKIRYLKPTVVVYWNICHMLQTRDWPATKATHTLLHPVIYALARCLVCSLPHGCSIRQALTATLMNCCHGMQQKNTYPTQLYMEQPISACSSWIKKKKTFVELGQVQLNSVEKRLSWNSLMNNQCHLIKTLWQHSGDLD